MVVITPHLHVIRLEPTHFVHRQKIKIFFNWRYIAGLNLDQIVHHPSVQLINLSLHPELLQRYSNYQLLLQIPAGDSGTRANQEMEASWSSGPGKDAQVLIHHISVPVRIKPNMPVATEGGWGGACIFHKVAHVF